MDNFMDLLIEEKDPDIKKYVLGSCLGLFHKKINENVMIPTGIADLVELVITMVQKDVLHEDFDVAIMDICSEFISEDLQPEIPWTIYDTKCLSESAPWCVDEDGYIIEEEFEDLYEADYDGDGEDDDILDAESKKSLGKRMANPKAGAAFTVKKKYDKRAGLSKKQIRDGYIKCPPGTTAAGKVRKKGKCNKRTDPALSRKLKIAARSNKASRKLGAKTAAKTKKRLGGRRRE